MVVGTFDEGIFEPVVKAIIAANKSSAIAPAT
jgi:hypothetical protein